MLEHCVTDWARLLEDWFAKFLVEFYLYSGSQKRI